MSEQLVLPRARRRRRRWPPWRKQAVRYVVAAVVFLALDVSDVLSGGRPLWTIAHVFFAGCWTALLGYWWPRAVADEEDGPPAITVRDALIVGAALICLMAALASLLADLVVSLA